MGEETKDVKADVAEYEPDYDCPCGVCGAVPTVVIKPLDTKLETVFTEMCGPCTWGEAETIDPDNW